MIRQKIYQNLTRTKLIRQLWLRKRLPKQSWNKQSKLHDTKEFAANLKIASNMIATAESVGKYLKEVASSLHSKMNQTILYLYQSWWITLPLLILSITTFHQATSSIIQSRVMRKGWWRRVAHRKAIIPVRKS